MKSISIIAFVLVVTSGVLVAQQPGTTAPKTQKVPTDKDTHAEHDHPEHGPHDGELLEVGKGEYHLEVCVDEPKNQLVLFLLDEEAKAYVSIDAAFIAVNLKLRGKPVQLKIKPAPQESDKPGFSSCFGVVSPDLIRALHDESADPRIALKIEKKSYTVKLKHDHDHHHSHEADNHKGHNHAPKRR